MQRNFAILIQEVLLRPEDFREVGLMCGAHQGTQIMSEKWREALKYGCSGHLLESTQWHPAKKGPSMLLQEELVIYLQEALIPRSKAQGCFHTLLYNKVFSFFKKIISCCSFHPFSSYSLHVQQISLTADVGYLNACIFLKLSNDVFFSFSLYTKHISAIFAERKLYLIYILPVSEMTFPKFINFWLCM